MSSLCRSRRVKILRIKTYAGSLDKKHKVSFFYNGKKVNKEDDSKCLLFKFRHFDPSLCRGGKIYQGQVITLQWHRKH